MTLVDRLMARADMLDEAGEQHRPDAELLRHAAERIKAADAVARAMTEYHRLAYHRLALAQDGGKG